MKDKDRFNRNIDRIMGDLDNIPIEIPSSYLAERIVSRLESEENLTVFRPLWGWLRPVLIVIMVLFNFFLCYLALNESVKALDQRITALDRLAAEYEMILSDDPLFELQIKGRENGR